jgi:hypothetical protein
MRLTVAAIQAVGARAGGALALSCPAGHPELDARMDYSPLPSNKPDIGGSCRKRLAVVECIGRVEVGVRAPKKAFMLELGRGPARVDKGLNDFPGSDPTGLLWVM